MSAPKDEFLDDEPRMYKILHKWSTPFGGHYYHLHKILYILSRIHTWSLERLFLHL